MLFLSCLLCADVLIDLNTQVDMHFRKAGEAYEPEEEYSDDPIGKVLDAAEPGHGAQDTDSVTFEQLASRYGAVLPLILMVC